MTLNFIHKIYFYHFSILVYKWPILLVVKKLFFVPEFITLSFNHFSWEKKEREKTPNSNVKRESDR
jgi:hypothetical protein